MTEPSADEFLVTLRQVNAWPIEKRVELTKLVLTRIADEAKPTDKSGRKSFRDLVGILKTEGPPPTDAEIGAMIEEKRMRKYGQ